MRREESRGVVGPKAGVVISLVVLCSLAASAYTTLGIPDAEALQRAQTAQKAGQYDEAERTYLRIMSDYPLAPEAFESRIHLTVLQAVSGRLPQAVESFQTTAQNFAVDGRAEQAFRLVAYDSLRSPDHAKALRFCKSAVDACPVSARGLWAQTALVISKGNTNEPNEQEAVVKLLEDYFGDPQAAEAISLVGWNYRRLEKPGTARVFYQHVVNTWPTSQQAIYAQRGLTRTYMAVNDFPGTDRAVAELLDKFRGDSRLPGVASDLAGELTAKGERVRARALYQYVVDNHTASSEAMMAQVRAVQLNVELGDNPAAASGFGNLVAQWPTAERLPQSIVWIADSYRKTGQWRNAGLLCEHVISHHANDPYAIMAEAMGWGCSDTAILSDPNAPDIADRLWSTHAEDAMTPKAAYMGVETLRDRAAACGREGQQSAAQMLWRKGAQVCEKISVRSPESPYAARAMIMRGDCLTQLGEKSRAAACYRRAAEQWPEDEYAWSALLKAARICEEGADLSKASTRAVIRSCYVQLVNRYPDCAAAAYARHWLSINSD